MYTNTIIVHYTKEENNYQKMAKTLSKITKKL